VIKVYEDKLHYKKGKWEIGKICEIGKAEEIGKEGEIGKAGELWKV